MFTFNSLSDRKDIESELECFLEYRNKNSLEIQSFFISVKNSVSVDKAKFNIKDFIRHEAELNIYVEITLNNSSENHHLLEVVPISKYEFDSSFFFLKRLLLKRKNNFDFEYIRPKLIERNISHQATSMIEYDPSINDKYQKVEFLKSFFLLSRQPTKQQNHLWVLWLSWKNKIRIICEFEFADEFRVFFEFTERLFKRNGTGTGYALFKKGIIPDKYYGDNMCGHHLSIRIDWLHISIQNIDDIWYNLAIDLINNQFGEEMSFINGAWIKLFTTYGELELWINISSKSIILNIEKKLLIILIIFKFETRIKPD